MDRYLQIFSRWFSFLVTNILKYIHADPCFWLKKIKYIFVFRLWVDQLGENNVIWGEGTVPCFPWMEVVMAGANFRRVPSPRKHTHPYHHGPPQDLLTHILSWTYTPNAINLHTLTYQPTYITGPVFYNMFLWSWRDSTLQLGRLRE